MSRSAITVVTFLFFAFNINGQTTKGNWLAGGSGTFLSSKSEASTVSNINRTYFRVEPNVGYFIIDKLALGINGLIEHEKTKFGSDSKSEQTYFGVGPFARYYFLPSDNQVNLFSEGNFQQYVLNPGNESSNSYSIHAGTSIFFNTSVALELTAGYSITNYANSDLKYKIFQIGLGFQIHLEKAE